ncbi:MAG: aromatic ring-hydroxylating dioxygenase subunit alpha [Acidimicrobiales bacterium]
MALLVLTSEPRLRSCWHPVAFAAEVTDQPSARRLLGTGIVLWRTPDGRVRAAVDRCPHRWAPLSAGCTTDGLLTCPYHGWGFDGDGRAVHVPQLAVEAELPATWGLDVLPVCERYGLVWTSFDPEPSPPMVELPEFDDPAFQVIPIGVIRYATSAPVVIDNNTDVTHVAFVHTGTFGRDQDPRVPPNLVTVDEHRVVIETPSIGVAESPGADTQGSRSSRTEMWLPFTQVSRLSYSDGSVHVLFKALCPVDDRTTDVHFTVLRSEVEPADPGRVREFELAVEAEDRSMLDLIPPEFPLDPRAQVHLKHDRAGIAYRRALAALLGHLPD